ncbi:AAA family ATPase [Streptomyces yangpuensis]
MVFAENADVIGQDLFAQRERVVVTADEPEAGLHPEASRLQVQWMYERVARGCQFVIATHSMTFASLSRARHIRFRPNRPL